MLASITDWNDFVYWVSGSGLEIVLLLSGSFLLVRASRHVLRYLTHAQGEGEPLGHRPDLRRHRAEAQAFGWLVTTVVSLVVGALIAERFGLPLATLVPTATVVGVAVGFGAQRLVQDVLSGFFLLAERQLNIGDVVTISAPGTTEGVGGTVEEVTLRVTRLRTIKGEVVFVPNGEIRQVTNMSVDWARLVVDVPLRPEDDVNRAIEVLREVSAEMAEDDMWSAMLLESPEVLGVQAINVGVVQVRVVARVRAADQWEAGRELRRRIALGLTKAGIEPVSSMFSRPMP